MRLFGLIMLMAIHHVVILIVYGQTALAGSIDLGWHYTLERYIEDGLRLGEWSSRDLGPMADYPPLAHMLAAVLAIGASVHSLIAINLVALTAVFATYVALFLLIPAGFRVVAGFVAAAVHFVFASSGFNGFTGVELIGNFFYGQVVGDAVFIALVTAIAYWRSRLVLLVAASVGTVVLGTFFNLSAVKFTIFLSIYQIVYFWVSDHRSIRIASQMLLPVVVSLLATVLHPNFFGMVWNAGHDGGTTLTGTALAATAILSAFAGGALIVLAIRLSEGLFSLALGSLAVALALALAMQYAVLWVTGVGSFYAVSKHGALTATVGMFAFSACISLTYRPFRYELGAAAILPAYFTVQVLGHPGPPIWPAVHYMADVQSMANENPDAISEAMSYNRELSVQLNLAAALGEMGMDGWSSEMYEQLGWFQVVPEYYSLANYAIVGPGQSSALPEDCLIESRPSARLVRIGCLEAPQ